MLLLHGRSDETASSSSSTTTPSSSSTSSDHEHHRKRHEEEDDCPEEIKLMSVIRTHFLVQQAGSTVAGTVNLWFTMLGIDSVKSPVTHFCRKFLLGLHYSKKKVPRFTNFYLVKKVHPFINFCRLLFVRKAARSTKFCML